MHTPRPTVVLADDHAALLEAVRTMLSAEFEVVASASDGLGLVEQAHAHRAQLLVVDIEMPGISGLMAIERLRAEGCESIPVVLTSFADAQLAQNALQRGARGFVIKDRMSEDLIPALYAALDGETFVSPLPPDTPIRAD